MTYFVIICQLPEFSPSSKWTHFGNNSHFIGKVEGDWALDYLLYIFATSEAF